MLLRVAVGRTFLWYYIDVKGTPDKEYKRRVQNMKKNERNESLQEGDVPKLIDYLAK